MNSQHFLHYTPCLGSIVDYESTNGKAWTPESTMGELSPIEGLVDPANVSNKLNLTGRVIVATTNAPYKIVRRPDGSLDLRQRRSNNAVYSALDFLAHDTKWKMTLVAWPGAVEAIAPKTSQNTDSQNTNDLDFVGPSPKPDQGKSEPGTVLNKNPTKPSLVSRTRSSSNILLHNDTHSELKEMLTKACGHEVLPVWLNGPAQKWQNYAENIIWPILHYIQGEPTDGKEETEWWDAYVALNEAFATEILKTYQPGDMVWIHDYYLWLLPAILRQKQPQAYLSVQMHAPFPSSEYFRSLSRREDLLRGLLGSNVIATQSESCTRHLISCCTRILDVEAKDRYVVAHEAKISIYTLPVGIDSSRVEAAAFAEEVDAKVKAIRGAYKDKYLIVGSDRLDSVRGVVQKLHAFEMFLESYPDMADRVVLIQVTSPAYSNAARNEKKVSELVALINGTYGRLQHTPVHHYPRHISRTEYLALLRAADLALNTSLRDGMNTTTLEFIVCQKYKCAPLIVSEFTGTAQSLVDSILVNPWDAKVVAQTMYECLRSVQPNDGQSCTNPANAERQAKLYQHVTTHTVQAWVGKSLGALATNLDSREQSHVTPALDTNLLVSRYQSADQRMFFFDYDGTLTPIVKDPAAATPSDRLHKILKALTEDERNTVWIISGRDSKFLEDHLGLNEKIGFSAEHGCFFKPAGSTSWENLSASFDMAWQKDVMDIFTYYTERTQGSHVERKKASLTWHFRRADPEFGLFQARECREYLEETVARNYDVEIMTGKANIEVRPKSLNKGRIVRRLIDACEKRPEFILCLGDDATDEDMFNSLLDLSKDNTLPSGVFPVTVGPASKRTVALWHLQNPSNVLDALDLLTKPS